VWATRVEKKVVYACTQTMGSDHATKRPAFHGPWPVRDAQVSPSHWRSEQRNGCRLPNTPLVVPVPLSVRPTCPTWLGTCFAGAVPPGALRQEPPLPRATMCEVGRVSVVGNEISRLHACLAYAPYLVLQMSCRAFSNRGCEHDELDRWTRRRSQSHRETSFLPRFRP
jgi:hypothetical protein